MISAQQQPVRFRVIFLPCTLSSSLNTVLYTLSTTVCTCTPCQRASFTCKTDSFLWGHGPDTLACKARPSFDRCGTSLSVSLSLSLESRQLVTRIFNAICAGIWFSSSRGRSEHLRAKHVIYSAGKLFANECGCCPCCKSFFARIQDFWHLTGSRNTPGDLATRNLDKMDEKQGELQFDHRVQKCSPAFMLLLQCV